MLPGTGVVAVLAVLAALAITVSQPGWLWWVYAVAAAVVVLLMTANRWLLPAVPDGAWAARCSASRSFGVTVRPSGRGGCWPATSLTYWTPPHSSSDGSGRYGIPAAAHSQICCCAPRFGRWIHPSATSRRLAAKVLVAAVVVCAAAVAVNYLVVYRHERAVDQARQQIAEQGPRIVEQMLSYGKDTLSDDFARAQALATDGYRPDLVAQQQAVQKAGVTTNEYWAVSSAVLPQSRDRASPDRAAMLLAMQGQRGNDPKTLRFITATVRVDFEKSGDDKWRVANLTVLKKPNMNQAGQ